MTPLNMGLHYWSLQVKDYGKHSGLKMHISSVWPVLRTQNWHFKRDEQPLYLW